MTDKKTPHAVVFLVGFCTSLCRLSVSHRHTSVVVYNREIFYGQGILEAFPGSSHHGQPLHRLQIGTTELPPSIFDEYLSDLRSLYTAEKYHLLRFNCNSFTADVVGFLTGKEIPSWISNLPEDVMSTPFGMGLRPQIEAMFARGAPGAQQGQQMHAQAPVTSSSGDLRSSLLSAIAAQASGTAFPTPPVSRDTSSPSPASISAAPQTQTEAQAQKKTQSETQRAATLSSSAMSPLLISTTIPSFETALRSHACVVALFLPPGRRGRLSGKGGQGVDIREEKWLEEIASFEHIHLGKVGFVVVDEEAGNGKDVADHYKVVHEREEPPNAGGGADADASRKGEGELLPAFVIFEGLEKINELSGLDEENLKAVVMLHIEECLS